ncbi:hypothetical protein CFO_g575 [Ceratocystis platani]|uniref:Receptor ligand binding region domain-containing protein n=1 Tax=Ceratocystis fimbriata f. sp. platani TaxID=88771 RepID=A0A0F8B824_CERFI|nr:hypothetical protein CFO_g575 [Ceratocystis platani]
MNLLSIILAFAFPIIADDLACNGDVRLCNRRYSNISLVGSHNSAFVGILPTNNHDGMAVERFAEAVRDANLDGIVYRPAGQPALDEWPTLQEFLDSGVRLIVFMGKSDHFAAIQTIFEAYKTDKYYADTTKVDYILPQFLYQWQNAYGQTDSAFSNCSIDRPKRIQHPETYMYMINHFLDIQLPFGIVIPNQFEASSTNSLESITKQAEACGVQWGVKPNVILLEQLFLMGFALALTLTFSLTTCQFSINSGLLTLCNGVL